MNLSAKEINTIGSEKEILRKGESSEGKTMRETSLYKQSIGQWKPNRKHVWNTTRAVVGQWGGKGMVGWWEETSLSGGASLTTG